MDMPGKMSLIALLSMARRGQRIDQILSSWQGKKASKGGRYLHLPTRTELFDTQRTKQYTMAPVSHAF